MSAAADYQGAKTEEQAAASIVKNELPSVPVLNKLLKDEAARPCVGLIENLKQ